MHSIQTSQHPTIATSTSNSAPSSKPNSDTVCSSWCKAKVSPKCRRRSLLYSMLHCFAYACKILDMRAVGVTVNVMLAPYWLESRMCRCFGSVSAAKAAGGARQRRFASGVGEPDRNINAAGAAKVAESMSVKRAAAEGHSAVGGGDPKAAS